MYNRVKRILKSRTLVTIFAVMVIWFSMSAGLAVKGFEDPIPPPCVQQYEIHYYTDPGLTNECGVWNQCENWYVGDCQGEPPYRLIVRCNECN
jgi:hypothetical protein